MSVREIGLLGEWRAAKYLKQQGMRILEKRYHAGRCEIDLIALEGDTLVFVEVKTRPQGMLTEGARAVNQEKRRHLFTAAQVYLSSHPAQNVRFDVIEISAAGVRHIRNAF